MISEVQNEAGIKIVTLQKCTLQPAVCSINKLDRNVHSWNRRLQLARHKGKSVVGYK